MTTGNLQETLGKQPPLQEGRAKPRPRRNQLLRQARKERRLSQAELAERIGVTNETISRWENGGNEPQPPLLRKLCEVLEKTAEELGYPLEQVSIEEETPPTQALSERDAPPDSQRRRILIGIGGGAFALLVAAVGCELSKPSPALPPSLVGVTLITYKGHSDNIWEVAWSPDGEYIASASRDQTAQVWGARSGEQVCVYHGHARVNPGVYAVAWSPNSKRIASGGADHTAQVWEARSGRKVLLYSGHSAGVHSVVWSPDGSRIASASFDQTVQVWNADTGKTLFTYKGHSGTVYGVAWSSDGKYIASASQDKTVQVWDASNGSRVFTYEGDHSQADTVACVPNGISWPPKKA